MDQGAARKDSPELDEYRTLGLVILPIGQNEDLVYSERSGTAKIMPAQDVDVLTGCRTFRTLQDHAQAICGETGHSPDQVVAVLYRLAQYARSGWLVPRSEILARAKAAAAPPPAPSLATLGVITRDRPKALERCLESYLENLRSHDRRCRVAIMDDSPDPRARDSVRGMLSGLKSRFGAVIAYAGPEEKARFREALGRKGAAPPDVLEFALGDPEGCGFAPGANRNALLLETTGEMFLAIDDDTVCRTAAAPEAGKPGLAVSSQPDPTERWHYATREAALKAAAFSDRDVVGGHAELLGKGLSAAVSEAEVRARVDLDGMDAVFLKLLDSGRGRIRVTQSGLVGDCAIGSVVWLTHHAGASLERLRTPEAYRMACASREVIRVAPRTTVSNRPFLMTYASGFDHRDLLPPFMPVMRFEDGLFAIALRQCLDHACIASLPWGVLHDPVETRSFAEARMHKLAGRIVSHDVLQACMASYEMGPAKPEGKDRVRALGRHLSELGAQPQRDFEDFVRKILWIQNLNLIDLLEARAKEQVTAAADWAGDVRLYAAELRRALPSPDFVVPDDLRKGRDAAAARELSRRLVHRFGRLMECWPDIVDATREIRASGQGVAVPL